MTNTSTQDETNQVVIQNQESRLPAAQSDQQNVMTLIAEMARAGKIDVVEKLVTLKNQMEDREAKLAYARDYAPMKGKLPRIVKNKKNAHTKSDYADLSQINEAVDPILAEYGFASTQKVVAQTTTTITIRAELLHRDGHIESMEMTFPIDDKGSGGNTNKTLLQGMSSTISYLKRVAKCTILDIAAGDDLDGNDPIPSPFITIEQAADIDNRLRAVGGDREVFLRHLDAATVQEIPAKNYKKAIANLNGREHKMRQEQQKSEIKS